MVEVYVPFVLILMSWNSTDPAATMQVTQRVYIDQSTCVAAGEQVDRLIARDDIAEGFAHTWRCLEQPRDIEMFTPNNEEQ